MKDKWVKLSTVKDVLMRYSPPESKHAKYFSEFLLERIEEEAPAEDELAKAEDFKQKAGVVIEQLRSDRDRLKKEFKELERKIRAWQRDIHDNEDDAEEFDFVFDGIYEILAEHRKGEE